MIIGKNEVNFAVRTFEFFYTSEVPHMRPVDQPTKSEELRRRCLMTVTFMCEVIRRSGSGNPNQFGRWFDAETTSWTYAPKSAANANAKSGQVKATLGQKKWYRLAKGEFPLSRTA